MIGVDIVKVKRFKKIKEGDFALFDKFFTKGEWKHAFSVKNSEERLAGIFAAKEAVFKACGGKKIKNIGQIEIKHRNDGSPYPALKSKAHTKVHISISHEKDFAIAVALLQ